MRLGQYIQNKYIHIYKDMSKSIYKQQKLLTMCQTNSRFSCFLKSCTNCFKHCSLVQFTWKRFL